MQSRPQWWPSAKRSRFDAITAAADRPQLVMARLVQVCRFEARSRYRRHFVYRYERADGGRRDGQGIALGRLSVARSDILAGKLVRLSEHSLRVAYCHYAVYPIASESNPALVAFR